jgi:hypothetical protein
MDTNRHFLHQRQCYYRPLILFQADFIINLNHLTFQFLNNLIYYYIIVYQKKKKKFFYFIKNF